MGWQGTPRALLQEQRPSPMQPVLLEGFDLPSKAVVITGSR